MDISLLPDGKLYIWLDDKWDDQESPERWPKEGWMAVRDDKEFMELVKEAVSKKVLLGGVDFDNDLGPTSKEGWELARWLVQEYPEWIKDETLLQVHSANPEGRSRIEGYINDVRKHKDLLVEMKTRRLRGDEFGY